MLSRLVRLSACTATLLIGLALPGCIKSSQTLTLMPDGSGKIEVAFGVNTKAGEGLAPGGGAPGGGGGGMARQLKNFDPATIDKNSEGIVAFSKPEELEVRGWKIITFTAYFEDINKVKLGDAKGQNRTEYKLAKAGDGGTLEISRPLIKGMEGDKPRQLNRGGEMPPEMKDMMALMFSGLEITEAYHMPGKVSKAEGLAETKGRVAKLRVTEEHLLDPQKAEAIQKQASAAKRTIAFGASELTADQIAAFKKELAKAKAEWPKIKADLEKKGQAQP